MNLNWFEKFSKKDGYWVSVPILSFLFFFVFFFLFFFFSFFLLRRFLIVRIVAINNAQNIAHYFLIFLLYCIYYSYLRASITFNFAALLAGRIQNIIQVTDVITSAITTTFQVISAWNHISHQYLLINRAIQ